MLQMNINSIKILGIMWNIKHDTLEFNFQEYRLIHQISFQLVMDLVTDNYLRMDYFQSLNWCHKQFVHLMLAYRFQ